MGKGVDQLAEVIYMLKHNPYDRRIILSAANRKDLKLMAQPLCHIFAQSMSCSPSAKMGKV
jgi:thymidylate synthase